MPASPTCWKLNWPPIMPDFFTEQCENGQPSDTLVSEPLFGLCDDATKDDEPAYVSTDPEAEATWIARVDNSPGYEVTFKPVDNCIPIFKGDGNEQSRCDGMLLYEDTIIFVELKEQKDPGTKWAFKGSEQVKQTIKDFRASHDTAGKTLRAYVANRIQPNSQEAHFSIIKNFTKAMKVLLRVEGTIEL